MSPPKYWRLQPVSPWCDLRDLIRTQEVRVTRPNSGIRHLQRQLHHLIWAWIDLSICPDARGMLLPDLRQAD